MACDSQVYDLPLLALRPRVDSAHGRQAALLPELPLALLGRSQRKAEDGAAQEKGAGIGISSLVSRVGFCRALAGIRFKWREAG